MGPQAHLSNKKKKIFTLVTFVNRPIQVIFDIINIHDFNQFGASSFAASVQLTKKRENYLCLRHLCYTLLHEICEVF